MTRLKPLFRVQWSVVKEIHVLNLTWINKIWKELLSLILHLNGERYLKFINQLRLRNSLSSIETLSVRGYGGDNNTMKPLPSTMKFIQMLCLSENRKRKVTSATQSSYFRRSGTAEGFSLPLDGGARNEGMRASMLPPASLSIIYRNGDSHRKKSYMKKHSNQEGFGIQEPSAHIYHLKSDVLSWQKTKQTYCPHSPHMHGNLHETYGNNGYFLKTMIPASSYLNQYHIKKSSEYSYALELFDGMKKCNLQHVSHMNVASKEPAPAGSLPTTSQIIARTKETFQVSGYNSVKTLNYAIEYTNSQDPPGKFRRESSLFQPQFNYSCSRNYYQTLLRSIITKRPALERQWLSLRNSYFNIGTQQSSISEAAVSNNLQLYTYIDTKICTGQAVVGEKGSAAQASGEGSRKVINNTFNVTINTTLPETQDGMTDLGDRLAEILLDETRRYGIKV